MKYSHILYMLLLSGIIGCNKQSNSVLDNGYRYIIHQKNEGAIPQAGEVVSIQFELVNDKGTVLDDSRDVQENVPSIKIPETMTNSMKRNPMLALVRKLTVGDSATIIVPMDSLPNPPSQFAGTEFINYVIKVNNIESEEVYKARMDKLQSTRTAALKFKEESMKSETTILLNNYLEDKLNKELKDLGNGLKLTYIEKTNNPKPKNGDMVSVQYFGYLKDGSTFDNSYKVGRPFKFQLGQGSVIKGWDNGLLEIPEGSKVLLDIPFPMAYGAAGNPPRIPQSSDLVFYIHLEKIESSEK